MFDEISGQTGHTARAEILACQEQRRVAKVVGRHEDAHEFGERGDVAGGIPKRGALVGLVRTAERGADGVDENQVGRGEQGVRIVHPAIRSRAGGAVGGPLHFLGTESAEFLPGGGDARCSAQEEDQRTRGRFAAAILHIAAIENVGFRLAGGGATQRQVAHARGVCQRSAIGCDFLVRFRGRSVGDGHARTGRGIVGKKVARTARSGAAGGCSTWRRRAASLSSRSAGLLRRSGRAASPAPALSPRLDRQPKRHHKQKFSVPFQVHLRIAPDEHPVYKSQGEYYKLR